MGRKIKGVLFNTKTEATLLQHADNMENFSAFVKNKIKAYMDPRQLVSPEVQRLLEEMIKKQITIFDFVPKQDNGLRNDLESYF